MRARTAAFLRSRRDSVCGMTIVINDCGHIITTITEIHPLDGKFVSHSETTGTKIEWMKKSVAELMGEIRARLEAFESRLPARINAMDVSPTSKLPYKVLFYREALIWRIVELGRAAFENFTTDKLVSGIVLTRAAVETTAALWYLCPKFAGVGDSGPLADLHNYLMTMAI